MIVNMPIAHFIKGVRWLMRMRERLRLQAARNALTLWFLSVGFIITWVVILLANWHWHE